MIEITEVTKYNLGKDSFEYRGTLRNEYEFQMGDRVFFTTSRLNNRMLSQGVIVGVLKTVSDNPEYLYTIRLHPNTLHENYPSQETEFKNIKCDSIFKTAKEAKESALKAIDINYELSKEAIERFFKQYNV